MRCGACGAEGAPGARFCAECGVALSPVDAPRTGEGEAKRISVVFCDLVGSTGLAERIGAEAMHDLLDRFVALAAEEVERLGGAVDKFMGDGLMAVVGVPKSREDHAERAVLIALGLRSRIAELRPPAPEAPLAVRIGINSGPVVVGVLGGDRPLEQTSVGDTINVAARLQTLAGPGEILVGEATERLLTDRITLEPVGPLSLRGRTAPVRSYRVRSAALESSTLTPEGTVSPLVGRERPLGLLGELLDQVRAGEGQVAAVVAEAGMGKTRMVLELRRTLAGTDVRWLEGRCRSYADSIPYLPLLAVLRQVAGLRPGDAPSAGRQQLREAVAASGAGGDEAAAFLLDLLGAGEESPALASLSSGAVRERTFEALRRVFLPSSDRPTVIAIEDVQWLDHTSEEVLNDLAERAVAFPLLLLTTQRPGPRPAWMGLPYATQIPLSRLRGEDAAEVVRATAGREMLPDALAAVVARGDGNPFFLEQLTRHLSEDEPGGGAIPDSVQGVLSARIDRLSPGPRRTLQAAAVLGREVDRDSLLALLATPDGLDAALDGLVREGFLVERRGRPGLTFRHALIQEVAYDGLLGARRKALHAAAGEALEQAGRTDTDEALYRLARHFARGGEEERAVEYLRRLAAAAAARHAHTEAARALEEALELAADLPGPGHDASIGHLTVALVSSRYFLGELDRCRKLLTEQADLVRRARDPALAASHRFWLAHILSHLGDTDGAEREARNALRAAELVGDLAALGRAHYVLTREAVWRSRYRAGLEHGRQAVRHLERAKEDWWLAYALCWHAIYYAFLSDFAGAMATVGRAREIGEKLGDARVESYATGQAGWIEAMRGNAGPAAELASQAIGRATDPLGRALATAILGLAHREASEPEAAIAALDGAISDTERFGYQRLVCWYTAWRADARLAVRNLDGAASDAEQALALSRTLGSPWSIGLAERTLGRVDVARAGPSGEARLLEALRIFQTIEAHADAARTLADLAACRRSHARPVPMDEIDFA